MFVNLYVVVEDVYGIFFAAMKEQTRKLELWIWIPYLIMRKLSKCDIF